ncbi:hypothetical protein F4777DRAFT_591861 [Nemania sp. FL0916]|nr:hypothetical protein F4777DRAFT_591861 [Nemania sp. FL0916]
MSFQGAGTIPPNETLPGSTLSPTIWRRACVTCTKAKRQCSKQVPRCRRCIEKGIPCTYPPPRRPETGTVTRIEGPPTYAHLDNTNLRLEDGLRASLADTTQPVDFSGELTFDFLSVTAADLDAFGMPPEAAPSGGQPQSMASAEAPVSLRSAWFLAPESWTAEYTDPPPTTLRETERSLKHYVSQVQQWMRQWVTSDHSPLHHPELYSFHMPRHTQDAYTAMAMYMNKTSANSATVSRVLDDRVAQLLHDQDVAALSLGDEDEDGLSLSIFDHLSRVQALLSYQVIRLFDGDIRMRAQAEALIPTLFLWNKQMLERAKNSLGRPERFLVASPFQPTSAVLNAESPPPLDVLFGYASPKAIWHAWILAESVRRTWQTTSVVQEVYQFFRRGWAECPGRLPNTMRKALWDAPSEYAWTRQLGAGKDPLLVSLGRLEDMFAHTAPAEIDAFSVAGIGLYGMERIEQWLDEKGGASSLSPATALSRLILAATSELGEY